MKTNVTYENFGGSDRFSKKSNCHSFMLHNFVGGYGLFGLSNLSRYQGTHFFEEEMYKTIDWIGSFDKCTDIVHKKWCVEKQFGNHSERYIMPKDFDGMIFETGKGDFSFVLDCRKSYDLDDKNRYYTVEHQEDMLIITYTKKDQYTVYVALYGKRLGYEKRGEWIEQQYPYDKQRGSKPFSTWVYDIGTIHCDTVSLAWGLDKNKVVESARSLYVNKDRIITEHKKYVDANHISGVVKNKEVRAAYESASISLEGLTFKNRIFAGFPWFFQVWSRDEMISLGGAKHPWKDSIMDYANGVLPDGRIPNRHPHSDLGSSDGVGWLFVRAYEVLPSLKKKDRNILLNRLQHSLSLQEKFHTQNGLAQNSALETWMDTSFGNDVRSGARIEMQAHRLAMYRLLDDYLEGDFGVREGKLKRAVRKQFFDGKRLADGLNDWTCRPNLFLAAYCYPKLFTKKEWTEIFTWALKRLWLPWGGLATIDKRNKLFCSNHTGENNKSYHRGDSWYFINNIAAIVLARINADVFIRYIYKILDASTTEILWNGSAGSAAEISSASELSSFGCFNQAWSNATYVELVEELQKRNVL